MTEAVDRPYVERRVVQSPLFTGRVVDDCERQFSGLTLVFRGHRNSLTRLIELLDDAQCHLTRGFTGKRDGQHLLWPIHSRQQCQQPLRKQLGFSRARGRADAKAARRIDRFPPNSLI